MPLMQVTYGVGDCAAMQVTVPMDRVMASLEFGTAIAHSSSSGRNQPGASAAAKHRPRKLG